MQNRTLIFLTHADVVIDPEVPVVDWPLSELGRARHERFAATTFLASVSAVYCSSERKARDGAEIHARMAGVAPQVVQNLHENDRSATGYLPKAEFEAVADAFFANPTESIRGWERAIDAQARVSEAVQTIVDRETTRGDILVVAHGGVGALYRAKLAGRLITRNEDQPGQGGGNYFTVGLPTWKLEDRWITI